MGKRRINILFTCVGRRVALVELFRAAANELGLKSTIVGTDIDPLSPGLYVCDKSYISVPITSKKYITQMIDICRKHKIDVLIPTIDTELKALALNKEKFASAGTIVMVSSPKVIDICQDKRKTYDFLRENEFGTPWTTTLNKVKKTETKISFPVFLKPWDGSASKGNTVAYNREDLRYFGKKIPHCLVQEFIEGQEYTCDVYVDFDMAVRCVVPRKRIQVRAGEVSKAQTNKMQQIISQATRLVERLGAGPGVITIQCFLTSKKEIKFIEINPRFGGGVPLSVKAGARFPKWLISELIGEKPAIRADKWKDGLYMLRYDEAIWCPQNKLVRKYQ